MKILIIIIVLVFFSCSNKVENKCNPVGDWKVTFETKGGDCFEPGDKSSETMTFTKSDAKQLDKNCSGSDAFPMDQEETYEEYGISGMMFIDFSIDGNKMTGTGSLDADFTESGFVIGSCQQRYKITGTKR